MALNTAWRNVVQALDNLKAAGLCQLPALARTPPERVAPLIVPSRYFNIKARRLREVAEFFVPNGRERYDEFARWPLARLREALLDVWGIGPETADSILLYALDRRSFVIDAYTGRIAKRHGLCEEGATYDDLKELFSAHVPRSLQLYNEYHALLVWVGHHYCKPKPRCSGCPLSRRDCFHSAEAWRALEPVRAETGGA